MQPRQRILLLPGWWFELLTVQRRLTLASADVTGQPIGFVPRNHAKPPRGKSLVDLNGRVVGCDGRPGLQREEDLQVEVVLTFEDVMQRDGLGERVE